MKTIHKPIILNESINTLEDLENLKKNNRIWKTTDIYINQLKELFEIRNPSIIKSPDYLDKLNLFIQANSKSDMLVGSWIYYPWNGNLVHLVNEQDFFDLRTNRNKNLITEEQQQKLYNSCIGIVGLSVGSSIAVGCAYQGIGRNIKLAESDTLETTNLNRVRAGISDLSTPKLEIAAHQIYEVTPYNNLIMYPSGLTKEALVSFVNSDPKPKVIFEIIDDFEMKILLRNEAKKAGIPVIMFSNLGDSILVDIERFDLDKSLPIFNGLIGNLSDDMLKNPEEKNKYAVQLVGIENVPIKALNSVKEIGKTLVGRPQLYSTVAISGALGCYYARKILLEEAVPSGRILIKFDNIALP